MYKVPSDDEFHATELELELEGYVVFKEPNLVALTEKGEDRASEIAHGLPLGDLLPLTLMHWSNAPRPTENKEVDDGQGEG